MMRHSTEFTPITINFIAVSHTAKMSDKLVKPLLKPYIKCSPSTIISILDSTKPIPSTSKTKMFVIFYNISSPKFLKLFKKLRGSRN